jgi:hypothetical protein
LSAKCNTKGRKRKCEEEGIIVGKENKNKLMNNHDNNKTFGWRQMGKAQTNGITQSHAKTCDDEIDSFDSKLSCA